MGSAPRARSPFAQTRRLRTVLIVLLVIDGVASWIEAVGFSTLNERVWQSLRDQLLAQPLEIHVLQLEIVRRFHGVAWIATAAVFLTWVRDVHRTSTALGARLPFSSVAAVSAFLVPFVNLVVPVRVMRELWSASGPEPRWPSVRPWPLIPCWWGLVVAAAMLDPFWSRLAGVRELAIGGSTVLVLLGQLTEIAAAALAIVIVHVVDRRRAEQAEEMAA